MTVVAPEGGTRALGEDTDPLLGTADAPGCAATGLVLVAVGDPAHGVWRLLQRHLDELAERCSELSVVRLVLGGSEHGSPQPGSPQPGSPEPGTVDPDTVCDHHDIQALPTFLLYDEGKLVATRSGAVSVDTLERFAVRVPPPDRAC